MCWLTLGAHAQRGLVSVLVLGRSVRTRSRGLFFALGLISLPTTTLPTYYILPTFYLISTYNFHWGMDALTEVGVNVDDPKNVLVPDLLRRFPEDVLRSTRNDLFESAKASDFHHFVHCHTPIMDPDCVINSLTCGSTDIFLYAKYFIQ